MEDHESYDQEYSSDESYDDSDEYSSEEIISESTYVASNYAKKSIEKYYKGLFKSLEEREERLLLEG